MKFLKAMAGVFASVALLALGAQSAGAESTLEKVKRTGKFLAGVRFDYPPIGSVDRDGKNIGFGVDIAKALAEKLGVEPTFVQTTSKNRIPLLQSGGIDADVGPTTPTKERDEVVDFTIVYYWDEAVILTRKGESTDPKDFGPPKKMATTQGSYFADYFRRLFANAEYTTFQEYSEAVIALQQRKVDGVLINRFAATEYAKRFPALQYTTSYVRDPIAIGVREDDSKWRDFINFTLQELWASGKYQAIFQAHFGYAPDFQLWSPYGLQPGTK
ncbi:MAG: transporter substrate-binding domain-containing protein [Hyphomicrobiaceae bacterium]